jgi:uncharacterized membrane protein YjjB (DUF3815 family)
MLELTLLLLENAFFSAIPAIGFAMVFNVPKKVLPLCALGGAIAYSFRTFLMHWGMGIEWASLAAASLMGLIGVYWARRYLLPRLTFCVAAVIPMIPGTYAFKTAIGIFTLHSGGYSAEIMTQLMENGLTTLFILIALSFGLALPSIILFRLKPIV